MLISTEQIWSLGLISSNVTFLQVLLVAFYALRNQQAALRIAYLLLFAMTVNACLKEIWQIPLRPGVNSNTYAFPSGHMQAATLVYLSLCLYGNRLWLWLAGATMVGVAACSIEHFGYHTWPDLLGGFCVAGIIAISFWYIDKHIRLKSYQYGILFAIAQLALLCFYLPFIARFFWLWNILGINLGINIGLMCFDTSSKLDVMRRIIILALIILTSAMLSNLSGALLHGTPVVGFSKHFMFGAIFSFVAPYLVHYGSVLRIVCARAYMKRGAQSAQN